MLELVVDNNFVDLAASDCDAGIGYGERMELDMIAMPIGPRRALCRGSGAIYPWEFETDGQTLTVKPGGPLIVTPTSFDMAPTCPRCCAPLSILCAPTIMITP